MSNKDANRRLVCLCFSKDIKESWHFKINYQLSFEKNYLYLTTNSANAEAKTPKVTAETNNTNE